MWNWHTLHFKRRYEVILLSFYVQVLLSIQIPPPSLKNATKFIEIDSDILSVSAK